ncbi:MAG: rod shape-determining protein MreD [Anaerolineae bacterium]|nr:rod shape-determining protein MreD [Anaerolineae bacterium]
MTRYISLPILIIAAILQSTVIPEIRIGGGGPDLIVMLVIAWALLAGVEEGTVWALIGGVVQDLLNGTPTGTSALALVVLVFVITLAIRPVNRKNLIVPPLVAAVGTVLYHVMLMALLTVVGRPVSISYTLPYVTLPTVLFNTVLMLPVFRVMGAIYESSRPRRVTL